MQTRIAVVSIIVDDESSIEELNKILHEYGKFIIGRMGIPYRKCGVNIISIDRDAPLDEISTLSGKIGRLKGITSKTAYSNVISE